MITKGFLQTDPNNFTEHGSFKVYPTQFENSLIITPTVFRDHRGTYTETYHTKDVSEFIPHIFVQDDFSVSAKNVLRGFHGNYSTCKLVSCPHGRITNVIVDVNIKSKTYGKWGSITFSPACGEMLFIPAGFGNLIISHEDNSVYWYKQTTYYEGALSQFTLLWNDPEIAIPWTDFANPDDFILSERDKDGITFSRLFSEYLQINY